MKKITFIVLMLFFISNSNAESSAQLMLLGTFHFNNPGLDVVKSEVLDVMSDENQQYLIEFSQRLAGFKPDIVMLEFDPAKHQEMNLKYQQYLLGDLKLPVNEMYQIGFRVAKLAGLKEVYGFDEKEIGWKGSALFDYIKVEDSALQTKVEEKIKWHTDRTNHDQSSMSLAELLHQHNSEKADLLNKGFYMMTNAAGAEDNFIGADAAASWWHRNFRMYAKLQRQALQNKRVFAIAGQGHTAILKDLLAADEDIKSVDVNAYITVKN